MSFIWHCKGTSFEVYMSREKKYPKLLKTNHLIVFNYKFWQSSIEKKISVSVHRHMRLPLAYFNKILQLDFVPEIKMLACARYINQYAYFSTGDNL